MLSDDEKAYVLANYKGCGPTEMAARLGKKKNEVLSFYKNNHLHSGLTGHFEKGHVPWSKGKTPEQICKTPEALERCKAGRFHKGHVPYNCLPVGVEVIKDDGYWWRKVGEPNKWRQLHRLKYEEIHGVKLKDNELVIFLDGDRNNLDPDNLVRITRRENQMLNRKHLRTRDAQLTTTGLAVAKLEIAIEERENEGKLNGSE